MEKGGRRRYIDKVSMVEHFEFTFRSRENCLPMLREISIFTRRLCDALLRFFFLDETLIDTNLVGCFFEAES